MRRVLVAACLALLVVPGALARGDRPVFELKSQVLTRVPEIAVALAAVNEAPDDVATWRLLGRELAERGAYADAIRAFEKATKLDDENPEVYVDLGATYLRAGDAGSAMDALRRALKLEPFHAIAHYNMGIAHQAEGNMTDAWDSFENALRIDPSLGDPAQNPAAVVNPDLPYVKLRVYLKTTGTSPALFGGSPLLRERDGSMAPAPAPAADDHDTQKR